MGCKQLTYKNSIFLKVVHSKNDKTASKNVLSSYRYNYQGQELDQETGKVAFQLRLYDPRINRWMAPDPAQQYPSPYMSMGNNWVNQIDPDGAKADDWYVNKETGELEWHAGSANIEGLTWVGTDTASSEYLSSMSTLFGGSGEVPFSGGLYWQGVKDYGSARWEQIKKGQLFGQAMISAVPGKGLLVNSEQVASNVQTAAWLYETDFGNAEYAYYGGRFTGGLAETATLALVTKKAGNLFGSSRFLRDVGHKSLFTFGGSPTKRYLSGFQIGGFRFQAHKHWLPLKGVSPGTKVPHINFSFGSGSNYHILLGGFRNNGSRFFKGGF